MQYEFQIWNYFSWYLFICTCLGVWRIFKHMVWKQCFDLNCNYYQPANYTGKSTFQLKSTKYWYSVGGKNQFSATWLWHALQNFVKLSINFKSSTVYQQTLVYSSIITDTGVQSLLNKMFDVTCESKQHCKDGKQLKRM